MTGTVTLLAVAVIVLLAGCGQAVQFDEPDARNARIEPTVVDAPEDQPVVAYNSSTLAENPGIRTLVRQRVGFYQETGEERASYPINASVLSQYRALNTSYVAYRGLVVRLALVQQDAAG